MRILVIAAAVLALVGSSAQAQMGGGRRQPSEGQKADTKPKVDEGAYKAALERISEPKEKYDPWGGVRLSELAKKPK